MTGGKFAPTVLDGNITVETVDSSSGRFAEVVVVVIPIGTTTPRRSLVTWNASIVDNSTRHDTISGVTKLCINVIVTTADRISKSFVMKVM
jgi:hypothetical protein